jgi:hypothetical protein
MKRILLVLLISLVAFGAMAQLKFSGSMAATAYSDIKGIGVIDADWDVILGLGPFAVDFNVGDTHDTGAKTNTVSFGYTLSASQALGAFTFSGSAASNAMAVPVGGVFSGDILGDVTATIDAKKDIVSGKAYALCTAKKGYPIFMGVDVSGTVAPKWGSFTLGTSFLDAKAVADDVGYANAVAAVEGLTFYAKAKVTY